MSFLVSGLDLGQSDDFSASGILEVTPTIHRHTITELDPRFNLPRDVEYQIEGPPSALALRWLERYQLGTSYPAIVASVRERLQALPPGTLFAVDYTGVGRPVVDMFRGLGVPTVTITFTGGKNVTGGGRDWAVPKRDLVHGLLAALQQQRFTYATRLELAPTLVDELTKVDLKLNAKTGHDTYEAWREGAHDDLVFAVAIAAWLAEHEVQARYEAALRVLEQRRVQEGAVVEVSPL